MDHWFDAVQLFFAAMFKLPRVSPFAYSAVFWVPNITRVQAHSPEMFMHSSDDGQLNISGRPISDSGCLYLKYKGDFKFLYIY